jgi:hypothetical protein
MRFYQFLFWVNGIPLMCYSPIICSCFLSTCVHVLIRDYVASTSVVNTLHGVYVLEDRVPNMFTFLGNPFTVC